MTNPQDIIGIVKDLQESLKSAQGEAHMSKALGPKNSAWQFAIAMHFPAVAQALLIAVEALEEMEFSRTFGVSADGTMRHCDDVAHAALSRIRSLPSA